MRGYFGRMNPTVRGLGIVALVAVLIVVLNLYTALATAAMLARIAFFLAIAFFVYLWWRDRRTDIDQWARRSRVVFYGSALLIVVALARMFWSGLPGYDQLGFLLVVLLGGFAMWRVWRDEHTYS